MIFNVTGAVSGNVHIPPSKSVAHRMLICAALADSPCTIVCQSVNRDMEATAACLNALGANITYADGKFTVNPISKVSKGGVLDCGESGYPKVPAPCSCSAGRQRHIHRSWASA